MTLVVETCEPPKVQLNPLPRTDGSCQYSQGLTSVIASVNGPIEVRARDELPTEATIEVIIKPGIGVGGTREKLLEQVIQKTLKSLILVKQHPRTLIQIVGQIIQSDDHASSPILLSPLLNCCAIALLAASIPLRSTLFSVHIGVLPDKTSPDKPDILQINPTRSQLASARSSHTLAFSKEGEILLVDSKDCGVEDSNGKVEVAGWDIEEFIEIMEAGQNICCGEGAELVRTLFLEDSQR